MANVTVYSNNNDNNIINNRKNRMTESKVDEKKKMTFLFRL